MSTPIQGPGGVSPIEPTGQTEKAKASESLQDLRLPENSQHLEVTTPPPEASGTQSTFEALQNTGAGPVAAGEAESERAETVATNLDAVTEHIDEEIATGLETRGAINSAILAAGNDEVLPPAGPLPLRRQLGRHEPVGDATAAVAQHALQAIGQGYKNPWAATMVNPKD